jgi:hypothetical protein
MKNLFLQLTGYSEHELLAWNPLTSLFYTKNGGLYRLSGGAVEDLEGPSSDPEERID